MHSGIVAAFTLLSLLVPTASGAFPATSATATMGNYPGNTPSGDAPSGTASVVYKSNQGTFTFTGPVSNLDPACESATCGLHIHEGYTCDTASEVGGQFWIGSNAWTTAHYTTDSTGTWSTGVVVSSDLTLADVAGRALVFHSSTGAPMACGIVVADPDDFPSERYAWANIETYPGLDVDTKAATTGFAPYPDYAGALAVTGSVEATWADPAVSYSFSLEGLEASVSGGLHVHEGTTCGTAGDIGGHYYVGGTDPWTTTYTSDATGAATGSFSVDDGYTLAQHANHAVVVHAADNTRVACAILRFTPSTRGHVIISEADSTLSLFLSATGLEGSLPVVTGSFHVHVGATCASAGGHLPDGDGADPWGAGQAYTVDEDQLVDQGKARAVAEATVAGFTLDDIADRTVVIHASDGSRIGCGTLSEKSSPSPSPSVTPSTSFSSTTTPTISLSSSVTPTTSLSSSVTPTISLSSSVTPTISPSAASSLTTLAALVVVGLCLLV